MAGRSKTVRLYIDSDTSGVHRGIAQTNRELDGLRRSARVAAKAIAAATTAGLFVLGKAISDGVKALDTHQRLMKQTEAAIKSTGAAAGVTAKHIDVLADRTEKLSGMSGDVVQTGLNMLLTFKNIRNETGQGAKIFDRAARALSDMTVAMGSDPQKQAIQLGKALNDPIRGLSALSRVGVTFSDQQKKNIKAMQEHGNVAGAQKAILRELESEFGGSAKAAGETAGGQYKILKERISDVEQEIAAKLMPSLLRFLKWAQVELPVAVAYAKRVIKDLTPTFLAIKDAVQQVIDFIRTHWSQISLIIKGVIDQVVGYFRLFGDILHGRWSKIWDDVKLILVGKLEVIKGTLRLLGPYILQILRGAGSYALQGAEYVAGRIVAGIKSAPGKLAGLAGDLGGKIAGALRQAASDAYAYALRVGEQIAAGVLAGLAGLPGKIAAAIIPGGSGTGKTQLPNLRTQRRAGGGMIPGSYAAGDRFPALLAGGEAVLNPTQIGMVNSGMSVADALRATGAPTLASGASVRGGPANRVAQSSGGRSQAGTASSVAGKVAAALANRQGAWDYSVAKAQLQIALAEGDPSGSASAYQFDADQENQIANAMQAILNNPEKALGIKGAKLTREQRTSLIQAVASAVSQQKSDLDTVWRLQHPESTSSAPDAPDNAQQLADTQAQLERQKELTRVAVRGRALSDAAVAGFGSPGDIGTGGFANAYGAARGGPRVVLLGDARSALAAAAWFTAGAGMQPSIAGNSGSIRV